MNVKAFKKYKEQNKSLESGPYFNCFDDSLSIIGISPPPLPPLLKGAGVATCGVTKFFA